MRKPMASGWSGPNTPPGRAEGLLAYVRQAVRQAGSGELWKVWLSDGGEGRPILYRKTLSAHDLTAEDIRDLEEAQVWENPERPSHFCIQVIP